MPVTRLRGRRASHRSRPENLWLRWSYSKLDTLTTCPLQFWFKYVLKRPYPASVIQTVGSALHFMAKQFYAVRYKTPDSFANAWSGFWMGVVKGEHGPEGFNDRKDIKPIAWSSDGEQWYWWNKGKELLKKFFDRNADKRGTGIGVRREQEFATPWYGFILNGKIDRLDVVNDGVVIVDYKMGNLSEYMLDETIQGTKYQIGYEETMRTKRPFNGRPLIAMHIESLLTGKISVMPLRGKFEFARLHQMLREASAYVRGVLFGEEPSADLEFRYFNREHMAQRTFVPRLPRGKHCEYCNFVRDCQAWERRTDQPTTASLYVAVRTEVRRKESFGQTEFNF
jgi:hypothetical protein